jgi:hypothetical protein
VKSRTPATRWRGTLTVISVEAVCDTVTSAHLRRARAFHGCRRDVEQNKMSGKECDLGTDKTKCRAEGVT